MLFEGRGRKRIVVIYWSASLFPILRAVKDEKHFYEAACNAINDDVRRNHQFTRAAPVPWSAHIWKLQKIVAAFVYGFCHLTGGDGVFFLYVPGMAYQVVDGFR